MGMEQGVREMGERHGQTTWAWRTLEGHDCALSEAGVGTVKSRRGTWPDVPFNGSQWLLC